MALIIQRSVIPAQAGIQENSQNELDVRLRGNDGYSRLHRNFMQK
jgi:hypothetical protein